MAGRPGMRGGPHGRFSNGLPRPGVPVGQRSALADGRPVRLASADTAQLTMKRAYEGAQSSLAAKRPIRPGPGPNTGGKLTTNDALSYLRDVKVKFSDNKEIYDEFLEIMKEFKAQRINTEGVIKRVKQLFRGHKELILGFNTFLPQGYEITVEEVEEDEKASMQPKAAVEFDQAINYVNKIKTRFASDERVYKAFLEILNMYRKGQKTIGNVYEEVAMLFRSHKDLLEEFTYFLPDAQAPAQAAKRQARAAQSFGRALPPEPGMPRNIHKRKGGGARRTDYYDDEEYRPRSLAKELTYFEKVKQRLRNREQYQDFLKALNLYASEIVSKSELQQMVHDILSRYPDLMIGFQDFLQKCEILEFDFDPKAIQQGRMHARDMHKFKGDKYGSRPISELDVTAWERCSTSYVRLPADYPKPLSSHRPQDLGILWNDTWVSVTSGSEDYSFKHMRKNQYEEALFRCEDDRYELDMVIESNASAIRHIRPLCEEIMKMSPEEKNNYRIPDHGLTPLHFRCIQKIYGEQGSSVVELVRKFPGVAIPVVLPRLMQKDEEWRKVKTNMAKMWQKVYDQNYHKSLDHRSFYFKQTDKKTLNTKMMMQEMKEVREQRRAADTAVKAVSVKTPFVFPLSPDLTFNCQDGIVHQHVFEVMKLAFKEILTSEEQTEKAYVLWSTFVEPLFGLQPHQREEWELDQKQSNAAQQHHLRRNPSLRATALSGEPGNDSEAEAHSAMGGGDDADDVTTELLEPAGRTADAASAMMDAVAKASADEAEGPAAVALPAAALSAAVAAATAAGTVGDSEEPDAGPLSQPLATPVMSAEADGSADGADEAEQEQRFARCRPLAPADSARWRASEQHRLGRIFYGNDNFFIFFRLHQHLYDRLRVAVRCAAALSNPGSFNPDQEQKTPVPVLDETGRDAHRKFMAFVRDLILGEREPSQFEDDVRALLGTNSYVLFTLDKLICKLVKQFQTLLADDLAQKLLELYKYESARSPEHFSDPVYNANAHVLLHEDTCFRFESQLGDGAFTVQLLEPDRSEVAPGVIETSFADYLRTFTDQPAAALEDLVDGGGYQRQPFLKRLLPRQVAKSLQDPMAAEANGSEAAPTVRPRKSDISNGLECKLSTSTSKVSYVLDTEDLLMRRRKSCMGRVSQYEEQQVARFKEWLKEKYKERGGHAVTLPVTPTAQHGGAYPRTLAPMMA